jgi:erythronate-4-phosphate dehydrogenase
MKIVADDKIPFLKGLLEPFAEMVYLPGNKIDKEAIKDADALIVRTRTNCNEALLKDSKVKIIATATIGYDHIDTQWCEDNGILWNNAPGCNSGSVMQYIASLFVHLSQKHNFQFEDRTLGVIGVGNVGRKIVKVGEALGMRIVMNDPPYVQQHNSCGYISLEGLLHEADIISLHVPLSYEGVFKTFQLINENILNKVLPGTIVINSSRGDVVDGNALLKSIESGKLQGAVLDVWENEPNIDLHLIEKLDIATPHIAGYSADGKANGTIMAVKAINNFFRFGEINFNAIQIPKPLNPIIEINCKGISDQEILCRAIKATYQVKTDDNNLRNNPAGFENQRGNYPVRREFQAYSIKLKNSNPQIIESLHLLGFNIEKA